MKVIFDGILEDKLETIKNIFSPTNMKDATYYYNDVDEFNIKALIEAMKDNTNVIENSLLSYLIKNTYNSFTSKISLKEYIKNKKVEKYIKLSSSYLHILLVSPTKTPYDALFVKNIEQLYQKHGIMYIIIDLESKSDIKLVRKLLTKSKNEV